MHVISFFVVHFIFPVRYLLKLIWKVLCAIMERIFHFIKKSGQSNLSSHLFRLIFSSLTLFMTFWIHSVEIMKRYEVLRPPTSGEPVKNTFTIEYYRAIWPLISSFMVSNLDALNCSNSTRVINSNVIGSIDYYSSVVTKRNIFISSLLTRKGSLIIVSTLFFTW